MVLQKVGWLLQSPLPLCGWMPRLSLPGHRGAFSLPGTMVPPPSRASWAVRAPLLASFPRGWCRSLWRGRPGRWATCACSPCRVAAPWGLAWASFRKLPGNTEWGKGLAAERWPDLGPQCPGQQRGRSRPQALRLCQGRAGAPTSPCQPREPGGQPETSWGSAGGERPLSLSLPQRPVLGPALGGWGDGVTHLPFLAPAW